MKRRPIGGEGIRRGRWVGATNKWKTSEGRGNREGLEVARRGVATGRGSIVSEWLAVCRQGVGRFRLVSYVM